MLSPNARLRAAESRATASIHGQMDEWTNDRTAVPVVFADTTMFLNMKTLLNESQFHQLSFNFLVATASLLTH